MTAEQIDKALQQHGGRVIGKHRDQWGFIVEGVILGRDGDHVLIDSYTNKVELSKVISIRHI